MKAYLLPSILIFLVAAIKSDAQTKPAYLVRDIEPSSYSEVRISQLVGTNGKLFFISTDQVHGAELWTSDGTTDGTVLVKDIFPGERSSQIGFLTLLGDMVYFQAWDGVHGVELWKSDGTNAGTVMVKDINPGSGGSLPWNFSLIGNTVYFIASDIDHGEELWQTDGTPGGTVLVTDLLGGTGSGNIANLTVMGGTLYFSAFSAPTGYSLFRRDTATGGNVVIVAGLGYPEYFVTAGNLLFFQETNSSNSKILWKSNGITASVVLNPNPYYANYLSPSAIKGDTVFFPYGNATSGTELWKMGGSPFAFAQVADILPGAGGGYNPGNKTGAIFASSNQVYFEGTNGTLGYELWKSDGTAAGTVMVKDICVGPLDSNPRGFVQLGSRVFFTAGDAANGREVWSTDGTEAGTSILKQTVSNSNYGPELLTVSGSQLFFLADGGLWRSDGSTAGTERIFEPKVWVGSDVQQIVAYGDRVLFQATQTPYGAELWLTDGTTEGTQMVKDIQPGTTSSTPKELTVMGGKVYFSADHISSGRELWRSDGTSAGTSLVIDLTTGTVGTQWTPYGGPSSLFARGGELFFRGATSTHYSYYGSYFRTNGTAAGTSLYADANDLTESGGDLYYGSHPFGYGLTVNKNGSPIASYVTYGDAVNATGASSPSFLRMGSYVLFGTIGRWVGRYNVILYSVSTGNGLARELITTDSSSGAPLKLVEMGGTVYFNLDGLRRTDGLNVEILGSGGGNPTGLIRFGEAIVYATSDPTQGVGLWSTNGIAPTLLHSFGPAGAGKKVPDEFTVVGNRLIFAADDWDYGRELWVTDGTQVGTRRLSDIALRTGSADPTSLKVAGKRLYFSAIAETTGRELFAYDLGSLPSTLPPNGITRTSVTLNGSINPNGAVTSGQFEYGLTDAYGTAVSVALSPNNDGVAHPVNVALTNLTPGTTYHYRLTTTDAYGQGKTADGTFTTTLALEDWRALHFNQVENSGAAADLHDADGDGLVNLLEYGFGMDPKRAGVSALPQGKTEGQNFVVRFKQPAAVSGVSYGGEWSDALTGGAWTPVPDTGTGGEHIFSVPMLGHRLLFMRVKVTSL